MFGEVRGYGKGILGGGGAIWRGHRDSRGSASEGLDMCGNYVWL